MDKRWNKTWVGAVAATAVVLVLAACAPKAAEPPPVAAANQITNVEVTQSGTAVEVRITGNSAPDAKIFKLTDPVRLVVDIADSDISAISPTIEVNNDVIENITTSTTAAGAISRIIVALKVNAPYERRDEGNTLVVSLLPPGTEDTSGSDEVAAGADESFAADEFAAEESPAGPGETAQEATEFAAPAGEAPAEEAAQLATTITGVTLSGTEGNVTLTVTANGTIREHDSYTIDNPNRLIIEVPNVTNGTGSDVVDVTSVPGIVGVTLSALPDRVRIIVEHSIPDFEYNITKSGSTLTAALSTVGAAGAPVAGAAGEDFFLEEPAAQPAEGAAASGKSEAAVDEFTFEEPAAGAQGEESFTFEEPAGDVEAKGAAPADEFTFEEPAAPAEAGGAEVYPVAMPADEGEQEAAVKVTGVDYLPGAETTSVKISYTGDLETEVVDTSDTEVTVRILNATLGQDLVRAVDTSRFKGPISMVKSFVESAADGEQGRVVVSLKQPAEYKLRKENEALYLEFPTVVKAAAVARAEEAAGAPTVEAEEVEDLGAAASDLEAFDLGTAAAKGVSSDALSIAEEGSAALDISQSYQGRKISLEFREADIRDVLQLIAEVSQLNIIAAKEVSGSVSITLKNVPWDQALDIILETNGLGKKVIGNVIRIAPAEQLAAEEEARLAAQQTQEQLEPLAFQIVPVNYADAKDLQPRIQDILSQRGTVTVDERTNSLLIKDIPRSIEQAIQTVRALDTQTGQVLIESRVVTTTLTYALELGIQWGGRFLSSPSVGNNLGNNVIQNNFLVDLPVTAVGQRAGQSIGFSFGTLSQAFNLDVVLSAFENSGQGRLVASPRISVIDNKEAEIKTGISVPITTVQGGTISTTFVDAVLGVRARPQITSDNSVIMKLEIFDNTINTAIPTAFGNPAINKNEAKTELLIRDGHTVVIGGIVRTQDGYNEIAVPFFNKVPFLGYLFRTREWTDERQEILIFMTPQIVRN